MNKNKCLVMVFVKNPVLGTVKTRLAATVGNQKALDIYNFLLQYTANIVTEVLADKQVLYSTNIEKEDAFVADNFQKKLQIEGELGEKMNAAFQNAFDVGYKKVLILGSDCYELDEKIIQSAFDALDKNDFVLGPAKDGGYYLLGMRQKENAVFRNKKWSTARVYHDTVIDLEVLGYSYHELPVLSDIDYLEDLPQDLRTKFEV